MKMISLKETGNYILTLGLPGSGKTTVQSFMTYTAKNYSAGIDKEENTFQIFILSIEKMMMVQGI